MKYAVGFIARVDSLACLLCCLCAEQITQIHLLAGSMAAELFQPCTCVQALMELESRIKHAVASHKTYVLPTKPRQLRTTTILLTNHPTGRTLISDWSVNSFINYKMVA